MSPEELVRQNIGHLFIQTDWLVQLRLAALEQLIAVLQPINLHKNALPMELN